MGLFATRIAWAVLAREPPPAAGGELFAASSREGESGEGGKG